MVVTSPAERVAIIEQVLSGVKVVDIESATGRSRSTVWMWLSRYGVIRRRGRIGGAVVPLGDLDLGPGISGGATGHGARLTLDDRTTIATLYGQGYSYAHIGRVIGAHRSTIMREITRAGVGDRGGPIVYSPSIGQYRAAANRRRAKPRKLDTDRRLRAQVVWGLNKFYSPAQISGYLAKEHAMSISHETIYQALYVQGKGALRHELTVEKALRSGRKGRKPQSRLPERRGRKTWVEGARISDRPAQVHDRAIPGHWEGDLVIGTGSNALITLVERSTRFGLIRRLPINHESPTVIQALTQMVAHLPKDLIRTLTWDQGTEMAQVADFTVATGCDVYFCDPHSPWQRGTNENFNGLLRQFFPKGTNFATTTDAHIQEVQDLLNIRPRQTLDWDSPADRLNALIDSVALTN